MNIDIRSASLEASKLIYQHKFSEGRQMFVSILQSLPNHVLIDHKIKEYLNVFAELMDKDDDILMADIFMSEFIQLVDSITPR
jgi:hypothetical protein